jgi:hypothetical protein
MPIEDIYSVSQIAASIAVVISLIIIILQLHQAHSTRRTEMHQVSLRRGFDMFHIMADPAHAAVLAKVAREDADLAAEEMWRLHMLIRMVVINYQELEWQRRAGLLRDVDVREAMAGMQAWFATPGVRICWNVFRKAFLAETAEMVERVFVKDMPTVAWDFAADWKQAAREVLGDRASLAAR